MARRAARRDQQLTCQATRLRTELAELARSIRAHSRGLPPPHHVDPADRAHALVNPEQLRFRAAILMQRLAQVEEALARFGSEAQSPHGLGAATGHDGSGGAAPASRSVHQQQHVKPAGQSHGEPIAREAGQTADHHG